jgi:hypothetical protein
MKKIRNQQKAESAHQMESAIDYVYHVNSDRQTYHFFSVIR